MQKYFTKIVGSVSIMDDVTQTSLEKIQAAQSELEESGKFPVGIVSQPDNQALQ